MTNEKEQAYWLLRSTVETMAREILERRTLRPAGVLDAITDGFNQAYKAYQDQEEKANAGH